MHFICTPCDPTLWAVLGKHVYVYFNTHNLCSTCESGCVVHSIMYN